GRSGFRAGALRADLHASELIDGGNRPAAGANLDHLDHRYADGNSAPFEKPVLTRHLEGARELRLAVVDQTDLGSGAAHVEGQDMPVVALAGDARRQNGAPRGARF